MPMLRSSNLESYEYDAEEETLTITFKSGQSYQYDGVPQSVVERLASAASPGKFFYAAIRDSYSFTEV